MTISRAKDGARRPPAHPPVARRRSWMERSTRAVLLGAVVVLSSFEPATARWNVHDGNHVTEFTAPIGASEKATCRDQLVGRAGFTEWFEGGRRIEFSPSAGARARYSAFRVPREVQLIKQTDANGNEVVGYEVDGVFHRAPRAGRFTTDRRELLASPIPRDTLPSEDGNFVVTATRFSAPLTAVRAGDNVKVWPFESDGTTTVDLTAVDCGDTGFISQWEGSLGFCPRAASRLHRGDVNGDRRDDLLCHTPDTGAVAAAMATPKGRFTTVQWSTAQGPCAGSSAALHMGDYSGDGRDDAVCHRSDTGMLAIQQSNPAGRFPIVTWARDLDFCVGRPSQVGVGDFNGDGREDLVCHRPASGRTTVALATRGDRIAVTKPTRSAVCAGSTGEVHIGDYDGDGRDDLLCRNVGSNVIAVDFAAAGGRFGGADWSRELRFCADAQAEMSVGTFNRDRRADLICRPDRGRVTIALATSVGRFPKVDWARRMTFCNGIDAPIYVGRFNGDRRDDLLCHQVFTGHEAVAYSDL